MTGVLYLVAAISFASSLFVRMIDPIVLQIAAEFSVTPESAALLGTAFALPWALVQPVLGPLADFFGKTRVITVCIAVLVISGVAGALAPTFPILFGSRIVSGIAAGGVFPIAIALVGDLFPIQSRQVAIARLLIGSIGGMFAGAMLAGSLADLIHWRAIFVVASLATAVAFVAALIGLRGVEPKPQGRLELATVLNNYGTVFSNPRAKICYAAVFIEGVVIFGLFPYVALLLQSIGETRPSIAGLVVSGFALGGVIYSFTVKLAMRGSTRTLMIGGGAVMGVMLLVMALLPPWPVQFVAVVVMGWGFFLLHGSIQVQMTELAPGARGTAVSMHSFSYFMGQAIGPVFYLGGFALIGPSATLLVCAIAAAALGYAVPRLLFGPRPAA